MQRSEKHNVMRVGVPETFCAFLSDDIIHIIAQYTEISEKNYCTLMRVCTAYHKVFSSDKYWEKIIVDRYPYSSQAVTQNFKTVLTNMNTYHKQCSRKTKKQVLYDTFEPKIAILGSENIGNMSLMYTFISGVPVIEWEETCHMDECFRKALTLHKNIYIAEFLIVPFTLRTHDPLLHAPLKERLVRGAHGYIFAFAVNDASSFAKIEEEIQYVLKHNMAPMVIMGNKSDSDRVVPYSQAKELADKYNCPYFETSAKLNTNVTETMTKIAGMAVEKGCNFDVIMKAFSEGKTLKQKKCSMM